MGGKHGFSLAEIVIAMGLFAIVATAYAASCMFTRRAAESAIAESTALNVAQSYMEQIRTFSVITLKASITDPTVPIPTMASRTVTDYIYQNVYTTKTVTMRDDDSGNAIQSLSVDIMPVLVDVATSGTSQSIIGITINYRWKDPITNYQRTESLRNARAGM